ncbi:DUF3349 domain-containing protein [Mycobacterium sp.]|uniref:DUF3349 domain-containing protein n=1 Tax=Mycobacterium sp. TaxID=1785 RepID=UPI0028BEA2A2|nr:DUF3349 domain-containing protein [Mycobacterium sp.]
MTTFDTVIRAGYPQGVPQADYVPLSALLRRRLPDNAVACGGHPRRGQRRPEHRRRRYPAVSRQSSNWPDSRVIYLA